MQHALETPAQFRTYLLTSKMGQPCKAYDQLHYVKLHPDLLVEVHQAAAMQFPATKYVNNQTLSFIK